MGIATVAVYSDADADSPACGRGRRGRPAARRLAGGHLPAVGADPRRRRARRVPTPSTRATASCRSRATSPGWSPAPVSVWVGPPRGGHRRHGLEDRGEGAHDARRRARLSRPSPSRRPSTRSTASGRRPRRRPGMALLVKASAGGGGRGMRVVGGRSGCAKRSTAPVGRRRPPSGTARCSSSAICEDPRHIEVQVLADAYGDTVALFERECSIQRRHQKIIEEAPSPVVTPALRARLVDAAVAAARAVGYVNAGTVEFVRRTQERATSLLPRDEHPAAGRAPGDRGGRPGSTWCGCSS